jgi:hypothetical protein
MHKQLCLYEEPDCVFCEVRIDFHKYFSVKNDPGKHVISLFILLQLVH